jgi:hypothetical protein
VIIYKVYKQYGGLIPQTLGEKYFQKPEDALAYVQDIMFANPKLKFNQVQNTEAESWWETDVLQSGLSIVLKQIKVS